MSSIAYITDRNMIEYHRLNGNTTMNFWRLSSQKQFTDFHSGDLLFFLAKGTERGKRKEKGLVGYGRFTKMHKLTLHQMWKQYGHENGYGSLEELEEAIRKVAKNKTIPDKMNCLYLKDVVFFQAPIYLSELGIHISNSVESYIYLDKENPQATGLILNEAKQMGIDLWSMAQGANQTASIEDEEIKHQVSLAYEQFASDFYSAAEMKKCNALIKKKLQSDPRFERVKGSKTDLCKIEHDTITIAIPFISLKTDMKMRIQTWLGHCMGYRLYFNKKSPYSLELRFEVLCEPQPPQEILSYLESSPIL